MPPNPYQFPQIKELSKEEKEAIHNIVEKAKIDGTELVKATSPILKPIVKKIAGSLFRALLQLIAGFLIGKGLMDSTSTDQLLGMSGQITDFLVSLVLFGIAQFWSIKEKVKK